MQIVKFVNHLSVEPSVALVKDDGNDNVDVDGSSLDVPSDDKSKFRTLNNMCLLSSYLSLNSWLGSP